MGVALPRRQGFAPSEGGSRHVVAHWAMGGTWLGCMELSTPCPSHLQLANREAGCFTIARASVEQPRKRECLVQWFASW